ncbi:hypothetical protein PYW07_017292 [Mythimna separata]|uniref:Uncharacterized protein n=1 Tax=Mythimna separata TaxID=271217 RepID=A0AAD7YXQ1_MYTSE|nr:hypothetical protein PYW07_017292 [Mythimna separata]
MRDLVAAHFANAPAPQAPARNPSPPRQPTPSLPSSLETYNSHRKIKRPKLGDRKVYRPVRRHTLSRIDETPPNTLRPRSKSLQHSASMQHSTDFSSTRPILRSRSNISADTSRSVPVCNQSHDAEPQLSSSPQYAEPTRSEASSYERPASMTDLPIMVPLDPATGAYIPYPEYTYYHDDGCRLARYRQYNKKSKKYSPKHSNLYLAFMY